MFTVVVVVDVVVCGAGVMVMVGVVVNLLTTVIGIVIAYEVVLTDTDLVPYLVVQMLAVEN